MSLYVTELVYVHTAEDLDWRQVDAASRGEAERVAAAEFKRESYGSLRDVAIVSVTAALIPERRYHLDLDSEDLDLSVEEVG